MTETSTGTNVTDEMVETAARAAYNSRSGGYNLWAHATRCEEEQYLEDARAALEAVAPTIAAAALRDAADREMAAWEPVPMSPDWLDAVEAVCEELRARADKMEADREEITRWQECDVTPRGEVIRRPTVRAVREAVGDA